MAAPIHQDVPNCIRAEVRYAMGGNNASNVFHVGTTGRPTPATLEGLRGIIQAWILSDWSVIAGAGWVATEIVLTDLTDLNGDRLVESMNSPGAVAGDVLPANATVAIKADIGSRGRGKNGRSFWVGLAETQVAGNTVNTSTITAICAALNALNTLIKAEPEFIGMVVPHLVVGGIRVPIAAFSPIISWVCNNPWVDSQKDRLPYHKKRKKRVTTPTP